MAERKLEITIRAADEYSKTLNHFKSSIDDTASKVRASSGKMQTRFDSVSGSIMGIHSAWLKVAGVVASAAWIVEGAKQALEGEKAMNRLRIQIQSLGLNYHSLKGHVEEALESTSRYAMVQDDDVASVLQQLIFLTGDYSASVQNLNLVFDLAYQRNISHSEAAALVSKAMSGNIEAISKVIPELRILDDALGKNASAATKATAAMDFLSGRVSGAVSEMTEHERKVAEVTLAYNNLKEGIGNVGLEIASLTLKNLNAPFEWLETVKSAINKGVGLINPYAADPESPESPYPLSTSYKPRFSISKTAKGAGGDDESSIDQFIGASLRMTEEGLKAVPPSLDIPLSLNWMMLSDSVGMESELSSKFATAAEEALIRLEQMGSPKTLGQVGAPQELGESVQLNSRLQEIQKYYEDRIDLMTELGKTEVEINEVKNQQILAQEQQLSYLKMALAQGSFAMMSNTMQNLTVLMGKEGGAAFKAMKAFAIAETSIQTFRAAQGAYAALAPIPVVGPALAIAAAASSTIAGMARVKQIQSMEPGGSASGSTISAGGTANPPYSGGSPNAYPVPTRMEERGAPISITLNVHTLDGRDVNWDRVIEDNLAPALEKYSGAGNRPLDIQVTRQ